MNYVVTIQIGDSVSDSVLMTLEEAYEMAGSLAVNFCLVVESVSTFPIMWMALNRESKTVVSITVQ